MKLLEVVFGTRTTKCINWHKQYTAYGLLHLGFQQ